MLIILFLVMDTLNSFSDNFNNYLKVKRSSNPYVFITKNERFSLYAQIGEIP